MADVGRVDVGKGSYLRPSFSEKQDTASQSQSALDRTSVARQTGSDI